LRCAQLLKHAEMSVMQFRSAVNREIASLSET